MNGTSNALPTDWQRGVQPPPVQRPTLRPRHRSLGSALTFLLVSCVGASALKAMLDLYGVILFKGWEADPSKINVAAADSFDIVSLAILGLQTLLLLATGVTTMTWLYQAYGSREADPALLPHARWWTIGGWLIPFISLKRPFQLMGDLYRATASAPSGKSAAHVQLPGQFGWWWASYLIGNFLATAASRLVGDDPDLGQITMSLQVDLVAELVLIAAAVLFIGVLGSITSNLWRRANASGLDLL